MALAMARVPAWQLEHQVATNHSSVGWPRNEATVSVLPPTVVKLPSGAPAPTVVAEEPVCLLVVATMTAATTATATTPTVPYPKRLRRRLLARRAASWARRVFGGLGDRGGGWAWERPAVPLLAGCFAVAGCLLSGGLLTGGSPRWPRQGASSSDRPCPAAKRGPSPQRPRALRIRRRRARSTRRTGSLRARACASTTGRFRRRAPRIRAATGPAWWRRSTRSGRWCAAGWWPKGPARRRVSARSGCNTGN